MKQRGQHSTAPLMVSGGSPPSVNLSNIMKDAPQRCTRLGSATVSDLEAPHSIPSTFQPGPSPSRASTAQPHDAHGTTTRKGLDAFPSPMSTSLSADDVGIPVVGTTPCGGALRSAPTTHFTLRTVLRHPRQTLSQLNFRAHHVLSFLMLVAAVAFLVTAVLLGYLEYHQVQFTVWEGRFQARATTGLVALPSPDTLEELSMLPLPPTDSSSLFAKHTTPTSRMQVSRKMPKHQFTLSHRDNYTEKELLARYRDMDVVYTFLNGSELNHVYRRMFLRACAWDVVEGGRAATAALRTTEKSRHKGTSADAANVARAESSAWPSWSSLTTHMLSAESAFFRAMERRARDDDDVSVVTSSQQKKRLDRMGRRADATVAINVRLQEITESLRRHAIVIAALQGALEPRPASLSATQAPYVTVQLSPSQLRAATWPQDYTGTMGRACHTGEGSNRTRVALAAPRVLAAELVNRAASLLPLPSMPSPLHRDEPQHGDAEAVGNGMASRHPPSQPRTPLSEKESLTALNALLALLDELSIRALAAPTCFEDLIITSPPPPPPPPTSTSSSSPPFDMTNADVVRLVDHVKQETVDNRDRESDELRYSLRSFQQHVGWHTGRVLLVSPGHSPEWLDHGKNFFASVCAAPGVDYDSDAYEASVISRRGSSANDAEAVFLSAFVDAQETFPRRPQGPLAHHAASTQHYSPSVMCFVSSAEREAFMQQFSVRSPSLERRESKTSAKRSAEETTHAPIQRQYRLSVPGTGAPETVKANMLEKTDAEGKQSLGAQQRRVHFILSTTLEMRHYRLGLPEALLPALQARARQQKQRRQQRTKTSVGGIGTSGVVTLEEADLMVTQGTIQRPPLKDELDTRKESEIFGDTDMRRVPYLSFVPVHDPMSGDRGNDNEDRRTSGDTIIYLELSKQLHSQLEAIDRRQSEVVSRVGEGTSRAALRRLHVVHQNAVLPYGTHVTINSFTIEANLFRLRGLTPLHLYVNDDYFFNRRLPITKLVNRYGGVIVREDNLLETHRRARPGSADWREGVDYTNLFVIHVNDAVHTTRAVDSPPHAAAVREGTHSPRQRLAIPQAERGGKGGAAAAAAKVPLVPASLVEHWLKDDRIYVVNATTNSRSRRETEARVERRTEGDAAEWMAPVSAPWRLMTQQSFTQTTLGAQQMLWSASNVDASSDACWNSSMNTLFEVDSFLSRITDALTVAGTATGDVSRIPADETLDAAAGDVSWLPEPLPFSVVSRHHRRFSMHAPFTYCTRMFHHVDARFERELALRAYVNRRRSATDLHTPYLHHDFVLHQPWAASEKFLPYVAQLHAFRTHAKVLQEDERTNCASADGPCEGAPTPPPPLLSAYPPAPVHLELDNSDACAPATLLAQGEGESRFSKFVDSFLVNTRHMEHVEEEHVIFFNVNSDFTWPNVSVLMRTYLGFKFPFPSFLEKGGREEGTTATSDARSRRRRQDTVGLSTRVNWNAPTPFIQTSGFMPHASPFYPYVRDVVLHYAEVNRKKTVATAAETDTMEGAHPGTEDAEGSSASQKMPSHVPPGVTVLPSATRGFESTLHALFRQSVPLVLIAEDPEALCPLVRSLQQVLPAFAGRRIALALIPPSGAKKNAFAENSQENRERHGPEDHLLARLRAQHRFPVSHFMPVTLCSQFVGPGYRRIFTELSLSSLPGDEQTETDGDEAAAFRHEGDDIKNRDGTPDRVVEQFYFPAGTSARAAVNAILTDVLSREGPSAQRTHTDTVGEHEGGDREYEGTQTQTVESLADYLVDRTVLLRYPQPRGNTAMTASVGAHLHAMVHAIVVDARTGKLDAILTALAEADALATRQGRRTNKRNPRDAKTDRTIGTHSGRSTSTLRKRLLDNMTAALAIPGQLLALEDFTFEALSHEKSDGDSSLKKRASVDSRSRDEKNWWHGDGKDVRRYLDTLQARTAAIRNVPLPSVAERALLGTTVSHGALFLHFTEYETTSSSSSPVENARRREEDMNHRGPLPEDSKDERLRRYFRRGRPAVHWVTGASETDLLVAFPLPTSLWESTTAPAVFSYRIEMSRD